MVHSDVSIPRGGERVKKTQTVLNFLKFGLPIHSGLATSLLRAGGADFLLAPRWMSISTTTIKFPLIPISPKSSIVSHGAATASGTPLTVVPESMVSTLTFLGLVIRSWLNSRSKLSSCFLPRFIELTAFRKFSSVSSLLFDDDGFDAAMAALEVGLAPAVVWPLPCPCVCVDLS